ncbi:unnamed protein product [Durusdinium trenchii]|uniref:Uncharacterized protein n=1 Tax=Durusdinium trenchii TaxID=1381693 RepID=A0ABP0LMR7_9DINO
MGKTTQTTKTARRVQSSRDGDSRRLQEVLLQRPATGKACPHFGKRGVVEFFAERGGDAPSGAARPATWAPPRFNKYAGWVEWRNAIFLWVNAMGGSFDNAFAKGGQHISWYVGGANPTERSPIVQRLLSLKRDTQVILFIRPRATDPYINCGPCNYVAHNPRKKGFEFTWSLKDFNSLQKSEAFKEIMMATQPASAARARVRKWA